LIFENMDGNPLIPTDPPSVPELAREIDIKREALLPGASTLAHCLDLAVRWVGTPAADVRYRQ